MMMIRKNMLIFLVYTPLFSDADSVLFFIPARLN